MKIPGEPTKPLFIGWDAAGKPITIAEKLRRTTHTHVIGGSGTGKSKFLEWMIRQDMHEGQGLCVLDWHGTLYKNIVEDCAYHDVGLFDDYRKLILLNVSDPFFVTGFNPFMNVGADVGPQVNRRITATVKPWGEQDTDKMPTFERVCRLVYTFAVQMAETLPNASLLLDFENKRLRDYAMSLATDSHIRGGWRRLQRITNDKDWDHDVLSTDNRLTRFLTSQTIKRFMGLHDHNLDLMNEMEQGSVILVNLAPHSDYLSREEARLFAALFLNEFFETAMRRAARLAPGEDASLYLLYLDEFQEYITDDMAAMLDEVRKGGLHMVLAHQHLGHFVDNKRLQKSIFTNARIRAVFGGLDYEDASLIANEMFLPELNTRQIKKAYYHTIHLYREETRHVQGESHTSAYGHIANVGQSAGVSIPGEETEGWFGGGVAGTSFSSTSSGAADSANEADSWSDTEVPVWVPIPTKELSSEVEYTLEEKRTKSVQMLKEQMQRHCFIKIDTEPTQPLKVPLVRPHDMGPEILLEYEHQVYEQQDALPARDVDRMLRESEERFFARVLPPADEEEFAEAQVIPPPKPKAKIKRKPTRPRSSEPT